MQNQRLPKVDMAKSGNKRSRFNFSHDVNTTCDFGSVQPAMCKMLVPGSKTTLSTESLTRLAPMVAPTFGRMKYKMWHQFVEFRDLFEDFDAMLAQQPIYSSTTKTTFVPSSLPVISLGSLSSLCLIGARATLYVQDTSSLQYNADVKYVSFDNTVSADMTALDSLLGYAPISSSDPLVACPITNYTSDSFSSNTNQHFILNLSGYSGSPGRYGIGYFQLASSISSALIAPLQNTYYSSLSGGQRYQDLGYVYDSSGNLINNPVTIDGADILVDFPWYNGSTDMKATIAFRLSDFGKRIRKILIGCGYQFDLSNSIAFSVAPLFAYYKAYWNIFGLTQWQDWQQTHCYKLLKLLNCPAYSIDQMTDSTPPHGVSIFDEFVGFISDLGDCFITDSADFVSAHLPNTAVSPQGSANFIDVDGSIGIQQVSSMGNVDPGAPASAVNGHAYINKVNHGHLDEEYLKRLYKWTNRNTIIGRRIADLLRAQGLGKFVDDSKSDFIGYTEDIVNVSDVVSTADTSFAGSQGASLGEFGGKGVQYTKGKNFTFENEVFGFWVTLVAIVPESGYSQQIDMTNRAYGKFSFYNPEFDSLGYDASYKFAVQGSVDWFKSGQHLMTTFGFKPRYFEYKFAQNVTNGDISRRSTRSVYLPYILDRFITLNDAYTVTDPSNLKIIYAKSIFNANSLPVAGNVWRYPTKYPWLGNLDRIFANTSQVDENGRYLIPDFDYQYWCVSNNDNFLVHNIFDMQCYAPMLAVEDSFETTDDGEKPDMSIGKA